MKPCTPLRSLAVALSILAALAAGSAQAAPGDAVSTAEFVDLGALYVDGQMTLDASARTFYAYPVCTQGHYL